MSEASARTAQSAAPPVVVEPLADTDASADLERLSGAIEAIFLTTDKPISESRLAEALDLGPGGAEAARCAIAALNEAYAGSGRVFRIERVAGGWRMTTTAEVAPFLAKFHQRRASTRLTRAAIETLAIIAYRQPIARSQLEAIRGVACGEVLRSLLERDLIAIVGRAEELGRPMLYGVTRRFLEVFGLSSVKDLPVVEDASEAISEAMEQPAPTPAGEDSLAADEVATDDGDAQEAQA